MKTSAFEEANIQNLLEEIARDEGFQQPKFEISAGSKPGDNFVGRVFRTVIREEDEANKGKTLSLIFKASPLCMVRREKMSTKQQFRTESDVYQKVLPAMNNVLNKYGAFKTKTFPGTVRCLASQINSSDSDQCDLIVLEDKSAEGYFMTKNSKSLDVDQCRQVLKRLALWHAAALALKHYEPETASFLEKTITKEKDLFYNNENHPLIVELRKSALNTLDMIRDPYLKDKAKYKRVEKAVENFEAELVKANKAPSDLSCIIHGDCWFTNVLFKYNKDGTVNDLCLIDLQHTRFASPVVELSYLIFTCTTKELRAAHFDELIRFYHNELSAHLREMECDPEKIIPWELLQEHFRRHAKLGVLMTISVIPIFLADSSDVVVGVNSSDNDGDVFAGSAKVTDPEKLAVISKRVVDVIDDALRWNFI